MTDDDRIELSAAWAEQAYRWLAKELNRGDVSATTERTSRNLDALCDGLRVLADNLGVVSYPFPPPAVASDNVRLRIVK